MNRPILIPQISNIGGVQDAAGLPVPGEYSLISSFKFPTDSVLRWISISSEISLGTGTVNAGAIGLTIGNASSKAGSMFDLRGSQFVFQHTSQQLLADVSGSQRMVQIDMKDSMVNSGTLVNLYFAANLVTPPPGNIAFAANVSIAYNSLSEWMKQSRYDK